MIDPYRFDRSLCRSFLAIVRNDSISAASCELGLMMGFILILPEIPSE